jgi:molybdate transport system ATP-binding protein
MIQARLRKQLGSFKLEVEFEARAGVTVLFGASGSGKTLTLDCIAGFRQPDEGRILLDDAILYDAAAKVNVPPRERRCGYVFQNYALFPHMTLRQNLEFAVEPLPRLERHRRVNEMIDKFKLADAVARRPAELSGGQRQRGSIARALLASPKLLLLDEPARGLDAPLRADLYEVLRQVRAEFALPIILVTHDLDEGCQLGDEMLIMSHGHLVQTGPPAGIVAQPASLDVARLLGQYNLLPAEILQLDPQRGTSLLRVLDHEIPGRYYPGHFKGDRVWLCVRHSSLTARPLEGRPGPHEIPVTLQRTSTRARGVLLEFEQGLAVEAAEADNRKEWAVAFPPSALHVLSK